MDFQVQNLVNQVQLIRSRTSQSPPPNDATDNAIRPNQNTNTVCRLMCRENTFPESCLHSSQAADRYTMSTTHPTHPISAATDETVEVPIPIPTHSSRPLTSYAHVPVLCPCRRAGDHLSRQSGSAGLIRLVGHINTGNFRAQVLDYAQ